MHLYLSLRGIRDETILRFIQLNAPPLVSRRKSMPWLDLTNFVPPVRVSEYPNSKIGKFSSFCPSSLNTEVPLAWHLGLASTGAQECSTVETGVVRLRNGERIQTFRPT